jgi:hypothetical protein
MPRSALRVFAPPPNPREQSHHAITVGEATLQAGMGSRHHTSHHRQQQSRDEADWLLFKTDKFLDPPELMEEDPLLGSDCRATNPFFPSVRVPFGQSSRRSGEGQKSRKRASPYSTRCLEHERSDRPSRNIFLDDLDESSAENYDGQADVTDDRNIFLEAINRDGPGFPLFLSTGGRPQFERILMDRLATINVSTASRFFQELSNQLNQDMSPAFR